MTTIPTDPTRGQVRPRLLDVPIASWPALDDKPFRARQLLHAIFKRGVRSFADVTDLPVAGREWLARSYVLDPFASVTRVPSWDGSVRYLFVLADGRRTEAVYMPYDGRKTVCVSSMVGCPAGCTFCATGAMGFTRNLTRGEITGQLLSIAWHEQLAPTDIRNVVLMGMGEALLNYDEAIAAIRTWIAPEALDMSPRRITLSTVGLPSRIERLASEGLPLTLAVSLHAPDEETRNAIVPTGHAHGIDAIFSALHVWQARTSRRVTIEYTLLEGVNDASWQADALAGRLRGLKSHVNLIPFNAWPGTDAVGSSRNAIRRFETRLTDLGVSVSVRFSRGQDAGGACGQLALQEASTGGEVGPITHVV